MIFSYFLLSIELWTEQTLFLKIDKISKAGCKKRGLMQYKCMEKEIRKLHGRILLLSVMYIANIPAGMQLWQIGKPRVPVYRFLISLPDFPGPREIGTNSADSKKHDHQTKTRIPSLAAWARIPGRQEQGWRRIFLRFSAAAWFWEARNTVWQGFVSVFLCCLFYVKKGAVKKGS